MYLTISQMIYILHYILDMYCTISQIFISIYLRYIFPYISDIYFPISQTYIYLYLRYIFPYISDIYFHISQIYISIFITYIFPYISDIYFTISKIYIYFPISQIYISLYLTYVLDFISDMYFTNSFLHANKFVDVKSSCTQNFPGGLLLETGVVTSAVTELRAGRLRVTRDPGPSQPLPPRRRCQVKCGNSQSSPSVRSAPSRCQRVTVQQSFDAVTQNLQNTS